jgi:hypothetical protein
VDEDAGICQLFPRIQNLSIICLGEDQPEEQVNEKTWNSAGDQGNEKSKPEPECADPKKFRQAAANTGDEAVMPGPAEWGTSSSHRNLFKRVISYTYD